MFPRRANSRMNSLWILPNVATENKLPDKVTGYYRMFQRRANARMNSHWLLQNVSTESKCPDEQSLDTTECFNGEQMPWWTVFGYYRMFQRRANARLNSHWILQNVSMERKCPDEQFLDTTECYNGEQIPGCTVIGYYRLFYWRANVRANEIVGYYNMYDWRANDRIRLSARAGWCESSHFAHVRWHFFAWRGPYNVDGEYMYWWSSNPFIEGKEDSDHTCLEWYDATLFRTNLIFRTGDRFEINNKLKPLRKRQTRFDSFHEE